MTTGAHSLLQLIWLASPALPVGGFSYSEGVEAAVEWAGIGSEPRTAEWLSDQMNTRESAEFFLQTEQMGRSFVEWLKLHHADTAEVFAGLPATYPVAFAFAVSRTDASVHDGCLAFAFGWAENMVAAAVKAVPLGQSAGQRILGRLSQEIPDAVARAMTLGDERQAFAPLLAVLSARHETQYSRLFRS
jgi:urease accessory protein